MKTGIIWVFLGVFGVFSVFSPGICAQEWSQPAGAVHGTPNYGYGMGPIYDGDEGTATYMDELGGHTTFPYGFFGVEFDTLQIVDALRWKNYSQYYNCITSYKIMALIEGGDRSVEADWVTVVSNTSSVYGWNADIFTSSVTTREMRVQYLGMVYSAPVYELEFDAQTPPNDAPVVDAGDDVVVMLPAGAGDPVEVDLDGTVTDDGKPVGAVSVLWSNVSGPGVVTFTNATLEDTTVSFVTAGTYVLRLTADDSALSTSDDVTITVNANPNLPPTANAGSDVEVTIPVNQVTLHGVVSDDGLPSGVLTSLWSFVSGPQAPVFSDVSSTQSVVTFEVDGVYVLRLTAFDGVGSGVSSDVTITVNPFPAVWSQPVGTAIGTPNYGASIAAIYDGNESSSCVMEEYGLGDKYFGVRFAQGQRVRAIRWKNNGTYWNHITAYRIDVLLPGGVESQSEDWVELVANKSAGYLWNQDVMSVPVDTRAIRVYYTATTGGYASPVYEVQFDASTVPEHTVEASAGVGGTITPSGELVVLEGGDRAFVISEADNYFIGDVLVDGVSVGATNSYTFVNVQTNHTISAVFYADETGMLATLDAEADGLYVRNGAYSNAFVVGGSVGAGISNVALKVMYRAHSQSGSNFDKNRVTLRVEKDGVELASAVDTYDSESEYGTPVPGFDHGRTFYDLGLSVGDTVVLYMTVQDGDGVHYVSDVSVATFWDLEATNSIAATAGIGGAISPAGVVGVTYYGGSETFEMLADANYMISDVVVDGSSMGAVDVFTFENVCENHTIDAAFDYVAANAAYPQVLEYPYGVMPSNAVASDVTSAYVAWKADFVTTNGAGGYKRVLFEDGTSTVSEGIGYGMLMAVNYNDKSLFDALWGYCALHLNTNDLMSWMIGENGVATYTEAATDGDQKIAFSLLMADRQWSSAGTVDYRSEALSMIDRIMAHEVHVDSKVLKAGDAWLDADVTNPSYFMPAFYRAFYAATKDTNWLAVIDSCYEVLDLAANDVTGLVPDWCTAAGGAVSSAEYPDNCSTNYGYNAVRTPFYIAMDYLMYGTPEALAFCEKVNAFGADTIGVSNIVDGYTLGGAANGVVHNSTYVSMFAAGMMAGSDLQRCDAFYDENVSVQSAGYFNQSLRVLGLMLANGCFIYRENEAPVVDPGSVGVVLVDETVLLDATVDDDAMPQNELSIAWSKLSGPGTVLFDDASLEDVQVTFGATGTHVLALVADDGVLSSTNTLMVDVTEPLLTPPQVTISSPNGGADCVVYTDRLVLSGQASDESGMVYVTWSNRVSGISGSTQMNWESGTTNGAWRTLPIVLVSGSQVLDLTLSDDEGAETTLSITVTYDDSGLPADMSNYTTGAVAVTDMKVNGEDEGTTVNPFMPEFSWQFGDALNSGSVSNWIRTDLGTSYEDATYGVDVADFNDDGRQDVVLGNKGMNNFVLLNTGGDVSSWPRYRLGGSNDFMTMDVKAVDMNADGRLDVVEAHLGSTLSVALNNGGSPDEWERHEIVVGGVDCSGQALAVGDMTGDGRQDVVVGGNGSYNFILVNGGGNLDSWAKVNLSDECEGLTRSICVADFNGDGLQDVVEGKGARYDGGWQNHVVLNNGGSPDTWTRYDLGGASSRITYGLAVGDVNGDGFCDVAEGNVNPGGRVAQSYLVLNTGGSPDSWNRVALGSNAFARTEAIAIADVTGDGRLDVVQGNINDYEYVPELGATLTFGENNLFVNNGGDAASWKSETVLPLSRESTRCLAVCDLDGDGRIDFVEGGATNSVSGGQQNRVVLGGSAMAQSGYRVQVSRSETDLANGYSYVYDSGVTTSRVMSAELSSFLLAGGPYFWRVKLFSDSGCQSEWSAAQCFALSTNDIHLSVRAPDGGQHLSSGTATYEGCVSWNTAALTWENSSSGQSGTVSRVGYGQWTQQVALVNGDNELRFVAVGVDGSQCVTNSMNVHYDMPFTVAITNPVDQSVMESPDFIMLHANVSGGQGGVAQVRFFDGPLLVGANYSEPYGTLRWDNPEVGVHDLTAVAWDAFGDSVTSSPVRVTITAPNQAPTVILTAPVSGAMRCAPALFELTAEAGDSDGSVTQVVFLVNGVAVGSDSDSPYATSWSAAETGNCSIVALAVDDDGAFTTSLVCSVTVCVANGDEDGDDVENWWEEQYFGEVSACVPDGDADGDGMSNWQEFIALTDPTNSADAFVASAQSVSEEFSMSFPAQPGRVYSVECCDSFEGEWMSVATNLTVAVEQVVRVVDTNMPGSTKRYYRVGTSRP